jgi:hypothetical protein
MVLALVLGLGSEASRASAGFLPGEGTPVTGEGPAAKAKSRFGVLVNDKKAFQGYTLVSSPSTKTYLLDMQGRIVHTWECQYDSGSCAYLLENGNLFLAGHQVNPQLSTIGGRGGRIQEYTWDGKLVWDYRCNSKTEYSHHDLCKLPNGNALLIVRRHKTAKEIVEAGGKRDMNSYYDCIQEIKQTGKTTGEVVWEWQVWDHLVQDHDKSKANYGDVASHPELIDINGGGEDYIAMLTKDKKELDKLKGLGYVGDGPKAGRRQTPDRTHINSVYYNSDLDQIMLSVPQYNEVWIIDHSTTKAEAAGHKGGRYGKGGDLLYRWGNPHSYHAGTSKNRQLFFQHDASWIPRGCPGEGHLLVFNNGQKRYYSSVEEVVMPVDKQGHYEHKTGAAFGPEKPAWIYTAPARTDFYSKIMSGAQRLPNGNTLICSSVQGTLFEVTPEKEIVWKYQIPPLSVANKTTDLSPENTQKAEKLFKEVEARLDKVLTKDQKEQFEKMREEFSDFPVVANIMMTFFQNRVQLSADQKAELGTLRKEVIGRLNQFITPEQKAHYQKMLQQVLKGGKGSASKGRGRFDPTQGSAFRVYRYAPNYPGLAGRDLTPGPTVEALLLKEAQSR